MIDKKEEIQSPTADSLPAATPSAQAEKAAPAKPPLGRPDKPTKGEKWFDWITYWGINYFGNLAISVALADFFLSHRKGKVVSEFFGRQFNKVFNPHYAEQATKTLLLPLGGHITMIPVKLLEDRKKRWTYWLNKTFFPDEYKNQVPLKPLSEMSDDELPET